jgi:hypothetical protein
MGYATQGLVVYNCWSLTMSQILDLIMHKANLTFISVTSIAISIFQVNLTTKVYITIIAHQSQIVSFPELMFLTLTHEKMMKG